MSKIKIELYGDKAEIAQFISDGDNLLQFEFDTEAEGYITLGGAVSRIDAGKCEIDIRHIGNGEHEPTLVIEDLIIRLPSLIKHGRSILLSPPDDNYVRDASRRERILESRVSTLEKKFKELSDKIYGTSIF